MCCCVFLPPVLSLSPLLTDSYSTVCFDVCVPPVWLAWLCRLREDLIIWTHMYTDTHRHTVHAHTCTHKGDLFMVCGQPISGTKAHVSLFISGFAQRQPNLDISNKARLLTASLWLILCLCRTYIRTFACSLRKWRFSSKNPSCEKRGLRRLTTGGTELVGNQKRERGVWVRKVPRRSLSLPCFKMLWSCSEAAHPKVNTVALLRTYSPLLCSQLCQHFFFILELKLAIQMEAIWICSPSFLSSAFQAVWQYFC